MGLTREEKSKSVGCYFCEGDHVLCMERSKEQRYIIPGQHYVVTGVHGTFGGWYVNIGEYNYHQWRFALCDSEGNIIEDPFV